MECSCIHHFKMLSHWNNWVLVLMKPNCSARCWISIKICIVNMILMATYEARHEKTDNVVSEQVRHKRSYIQALKMARGWKFWI